MQKQTERSRGWVVKEGRVRSGGEKRKEEDGRGGSRQPSALRPETTPLSACAAAREHISSTQAGEQGACRKGEGARRGERDARLRQVLRDPGSCRRGSSWTTKPAVGGRPGPRGPAGRWGEQLGGLGGRLGRRTWLGRGLVVEGRGSGRRSVWQQGQDPPET